MGVFGFISGFFSFLLLFSPALMVLWICPCCYNYYQHTRELISAPKTSHKCNNSLVYWFCTRDLGLILFQIRVVIVDKVWFWYPFRSSIRHFDTSSINCCLLDKGSQMAQTACGRLFHPNIRRGTAASSLKLASPDEEALIGWINLGERICGRDNKLGVAVGREYTGVYRMGSKLLWLYFMKRQEPSYLKVWFLHRLL